MDENLFNGDYYEQQVLPIEDPLTIAPGLLIGMGASASSRSSSLARVASSTNWSGNIRRTFAVWDICTTLKKSGKHWTL